MKKIIAVVTVLLAASTMSANAQVTKLTLSLDSTTNTGKCPRTLKFKLQVTCSGSNTGSLIWRKSDNTTQTVSNISLRSGANTFLYEWKIASDYSGSVSALVNSSDHKESNTVSFKVTCK